jgi:hypothetical protein
MRHKIWDREAGKSGAIGRMFIAWDHRRIQTFEHPDGTGKWDCICRCCLIVRAQLEAGQLVDVFRSDRGRS